ncbi:MAG: guanine deaminase [Rhodospirillaceae bacterium]|nr:guanine deaminase [Rhodospirillaceae bacterium]
MTAGADTAARVLRGRTLSFRDDPRVVGQDRAMQSQEDGAVVVGRQGRILWHGAFADLPQGHAGAPCERYEREVILPGFIDAHVHFPQHRMLAAPAHDLLEWLDRFAFPEEARYASEDHARTAGERFLDKLVGHGTTSALVFSSVHGQAADCLFRAARQRGLCLMTGATMMDCNAPPAVTQSAEASARESADLIASWHEVERLRYALTVRFAVTSSEAQLRVAGELLADHPDCLLHTHLSESAAEIDLVQRLFPWSKDYTDVYARFGLVGENSVFAHGIHLSERECQTLHDAGSLVVHCPTSNTFLGSGLFDIEHLYAAPRPVRVGVATDIGGGTSYSLLQTLAEAYKIARLKGCSFSALDGFYLATLGNARGLRLEAEIGTLDAGRWADVVVLDPCATPVLAARQELSESLEDMLFALMMLGDDRAVRAVYVKGEKVAGRDRS